MTRPGNFPLGRAKAAEDEVSKHCTPSSRRRRGYGKASPPSPRLWRGKPAVAEAMAGQARPSIHTLTRSPAFAWLRRAKSPTLSTPEEHLIRPSATFFPSNAEKGNLMGKGYEGESSAASLKNLRRDGPDGQPHLKLICSSFAVLFLRIAHFWQNFSENRDFFFFLFFCSPPSCALR